MSQSFWLVLLILHFSNNCTASISDFSPTGVRLPVVAEEDQPTLEPIEGSHNFRLNGKNWQPVLLL